MAPRKILLLLLATIGLLSSATAQTMLWPIEGVEIGEGVVSRPQDMIGRELNFDALYIAAPLGTEVVAPADGVLQAFDLTYYSAIDYMSTTRTEGDNFDAMRRHIDEASPDESHKYYNGSVTIRLADGRKLHISGLRGDVKMKTGMQIKRGDRLGTVAYAYKSVSGPHISLSISTRAGKPDDPMTPFGLQSTFREPEVRTPPETLTEAEAREDLAVLLRAYRECVPSYEDRITDEKYRDFVAYAEGRLTGNVPLRTMKEVVYQSTTVSFFNDSHIWMDRESPLTASSYVPNLFLGYDGEKLFVIQANKGCEKYLRKEVTAVDDRSAEEVIAKMRSMCRSFDGDVQSTPQFQLLVGWNRVYDNDFTKKTTHLTFADGTTFTDTWIPITEAAPLPSTVEVAYFRHQRENSKNEDQYRFDLLDDRTMLLTLCTFDLNEVQLERIADQLRAHRELPYLVIDVRDNYGGDEMVVRELVSWFIDRPIEVPKNQNIVNSDGTYDSFEYAMNYLPESKPFEGYIPMGGKFIEGNDTYTIEPSPSLHYPGKVFILTSESTVSAATLLPSILVREGRAATVGRETQSGYYYMTALKFVNIRLPHSLIMIHLPLVKCVLDDQVTDRFPAGRGLLPDYEVPISYEEVYVSRRDVILGEARRIIARDALSDYLTRTFPAPDLRSDRPANP